MIFTIIKWYALLKGVWKAYRPPPMTVKRWDELFKVLYLKPIQEQLNEPPRYPVWVVSSDGEEVAGIR